MKGGKICTPCEGKRIEWTGAGGDYFLGIVVDREDKTIAEFWGTRKEILSWMAISWPSLEAKYVPMVYTPARKDVKRRSAPHRRSKH
jgi:hypothetical protein